MRAKKLPSSTRMSEFRSPTPPRYGPMKVTIEFTDPTQVKRMADALVPVVREARAAMLDAPDEATTQAAFERYHALKRLTETLYMEVKLHDDNAIRDDSPTLRERRRFHRAG